ncbi:hypothetical protein C9374_004897 [Naegleria lovaniensis]|uniref:Uncharacterized protein n=1 Tax=Naegleria lovaniensis TaxID=51637 RepID=A0AA88GMB7_NAELO|nr:uncharacterized protein C9374_004897 [Naegleria lovaniensis]KAG2382930.1 hypothetical protein C9374_004897 [Naegleria lovaniensis]
MWVYTCLLVLFMFVQCSTAQILTRVKPDSILVLNTNQTGYIDHVIPMNEQQPEGMFIISGSPNRMTILNSFHVFQSFVIDTSSNPKLNTMGVTETCKGGLYTPDYGSFNLVYSGSSIGKSYIVQLKSTNLSQIVDLVSLGPQSQVIDVVANRELKLLHIMLKKNTLLTLLTFDPKDNSIREQLFPTMTAAKMHFNIELGLVVGVGNATEGHLLVLDPISLQVLTEQSLQRLFTVDSITSSVTNRQLLIIYSEYYTSMVQFTYHPSTKTFSFTQGVYHNEYMRISRCEIRQTATCLNDNRAIMAFNLMVSYKDPRYYALEAEDDLRLSFTQYDDEDQALLYVPQTYFDGATFKIGIFNYAKLLP